MGWKYLWEFDLTSMRIYTHLMEFSEEVFKGQPASQYIIDFSRGCKCFRDAWKLLHGENFATLQVWGIARSRFFTDELIINFHVDLESYMSGSLNCVSKNVIVNVESKNEEFILFTGKSSRMKIDPECDYVKSKKEFLKRYPGLRMSLDRCSLQDVRNMGGHHGTAVDWFVLGSTRKKLG